MRRVRAFIGTMLCLAMLATMMAPVALAQIDRATRDSVVPAAVEVAAAAQWQDENFSFTFPIPLGSGTIVTLDGLILTNRHVVAGEELGTVIDAWKSEVEQQFPGAEVSLIPDLFLILTSDGISVPVETYSASVVAEDAQLDLAVLRITADASGDTEAIEGIELPYVPPGDSGTLGLGDRVHVFSYPSIGGDALTYTPGVVSGFLREEGIDGIAWITTDAVMSGGSSGGTAVNDAGELIGIPTQGSELDCRPGDTNRDGVVDVNDIGCIPTGGSLGQLRPVNQALPLLKEAANVRATPEQSDLATPEPVQDQPETIQRGPLDLPRLALSPADVEAEGLDGFVVDWSQMVDQRGVPAMISLDEVWIDRLEETNLEQVYLLTLVREAESGAPTTVSSTIWEYPTAEDAANGFAFTEQELEETYSIADLPATTFGEESELSTWAYTDSNSGEAMMAFEATSRVGALVGTVRVGGPASDEQELQAEAVNLGAALSARLENAAVADNPLSARVARVTANGNGGSADFYLLQDGEAVPTRWYLEPDGTDEWTDYWQQIGVTDGYETELYLPEGVFPAPGRVGVRLYQFEDEAAASTYLETYGEDLGPVVSNLQELRTAPAYSEESQSFSFETDWWTDVEPEYRVVTVMREGTLVAAIEIAATQPVPNGVVRGIAAAQAECLTNGCATLTIDAPAWLLALPAPEGTGAPNNAQSTAASGVAGQPSPEAVATLTPVETPTATPEPTATPSPEPTLTPTPEPAPEIWGMYEAFDDPEVLDTTDSDVSTWDIENGVFRLAITEPGNIDGVTVSNLPTEGRDVSLQAEIAGTRGWGEIMLWIIGEDGVTEWHFAVDPVARQWSLYRSSEADSDLFYWVEPRPLPETVGDDIEQLELQVIDGLPVLFINGVDVVTPTGVDMPDVPGSVTLGFGAGVNPGSLSGSGDNFSVDFDAVSLFEVAD